MGRVNFTKMGFEQGSTWGTEVALGDNDGLWPLSLDVARFDRAFLEDPSLTGVPFPNLGDIGDRMFEGSLSLRWRYGYGCPKLAALCLGAVGTPSGAGPYTHPIAVQDRLTKFLTLAWTKVTNASTTVYESVPSAMVEEVTWAVSQGEPGTMTVRLVGSNGARDAGTNGSTQFGNLTYTDERSPVLGTDGVFRLNAQGGGSLGSGDVLKPTSVAVTVRRPLARDHKMDSGLAGKAAQPVEDGVAEVRLELGFSGLGSAGSFASDPDEFMDAFDAATEKKADLTMTKNSNNAWLFQFPRLQVVQDPPHSLPNAGRLPHVVVLRGLVASAAPTGMSGVTQPLVLTVTDQLSAAYLS